MITTESDEYAEKMRSFKNFGSAKVGTEVRFIRYGSNYKMSDILAAVGVAQMAKLPKIIERRIELAKNYDKLLNDVDGIRPPSGGKGLKHIYQTYAAYVEVEGARDKLIQHLRGLGIEAQIGTYALHMEPYYQNLERQGNLERSRKLYENLIALPMSHNMTSEDQRRVVTELGKFLKSFGR
jgi:dTDP-4-amino-4,6-dideoxygalactose transaminase